MIRAAAILAALALVAPVAADLPSSLPPWYDVKLYVVDPPAVGRPGEVEVAFRALLEAPTRLDVELVPTEEIAPIAPQSWEFRGITGRGDTLRGRLRFALRGQGRATVPIRFRTAWPKSGFRQWLVRYGGQLPLGRRTWTLEYIDHLEGDAVWDEPLHLVVTEDETAWSHESMPTVAEHAPVRLGARLGAWNHLPCPVAGSDPLQAHLDKVFADLLAGRRAEAERGLHAARVAFPPAEAQTLQPDLDDARIANLEALVALIDGHTEGPAVTRLEQLAYHPWWPPGAERYAGYLQANHAEFVALRGRRAEALMVLRSAIAHHPGLWSAERRLAEIRARP